MKKLECPTCGEAFSHEAWNKNTKEIVNMLNDNENDIVKIENRVEGMLYRCPNTLCEDEVTTDKDLNLIIQDGE
jgi:hypothetical protein